MTATLTILDDDSLVVNTNDDRGPGSLRRAIDTANDHDNPGLDTIRFAIPAAMSPTIRLDSALPAITDPLFIDGFSQPGSRPDTSRQGGIDAAPLIRLDGSRLARLNRRGAGERPGHSIAGAAAAR